MDTRPPRSFVYDQNGDMHPLTYCIAIGISILIHVALIVFAGDNAIRFMTPVEATDVQKLALRQDYAIRVHDFPDDPERVYESVFEPVKTPYAVEMEDLLTAVPTDAPGGMLEPPAIPSELSGGMEAAIQTPPVADRVEPPRVWQPREPLLMLVDQITYSDTAPYARRDVQTIVRRAFAPDVALPMLLTDALESANRVGTPAYVAPQPPAVDAAVSETFKGGDRAPPESVEAGPVASGEAAADFFREIPAEVAPATPIENVLVATPVVYRPRRSDGHAYFRIDINRKGEDVLPPLPRDILLVQDASASLAMQRLHFCRQALVAVIDALQPEDRFNVLTFNTEYVYCFGKTWRSPTEANRAEARTFVEAIEPEGNTDIFTAIQSVLEMPRDPDRPMIVLFLSDGHSTAGDLQRDSEIIGQFSALNEGRISIFNVGVSRNSNAFLMSMLSYCNRGADALIAPDRFKITSLVDALHRSIARPVLTDIRFMFDTVSGAEVAPEVTAHLYLDRPMQLFGRVPEDQQRVVFQVRGLSGGTPYDMVFSLDLDEAARGESSLATDWAQARMFDAVGRQARDPDPKNLREMNELGRRYRIPVPFRDRLF